MSRSRKALAIGGIALFFLAACSSGSGDEQGSDTSNEELAVRGLDPDALRDAVIFIEAEGDYSPIELVGSAETVRQAGTGSGFIIDSEGIAVTNYHVVGGARNVRVKIGGEGDFLDAEVIGVAPCSDLAVIDIEDDGYRFLEWYDSDIDLNLDVRSAGYPLGDEELTLTSGIVSKADADGDMPWASIAAVVEHDARINPGSSGGPLVNADDGNVVGVNYAGNPDTDQNLAIASELAQKIVADLRNGDNVDDIGINGEAIIDGDEAGVWVSSVDKNSPADDAGVQAGDIILKLDGKRTVDDAGSIAPYCKSINREGADNEIDIEVLRYASEEILRGTLNSGDELEQAVSFGDDAEDEFGVDDTGAEYDDYIFVYDDTDSIRMEVPSTWTGVLTTPLPPDAGVVAGDPQIIASPDLDAYLADDWTVPGAELVLTDDLNDTDLSVILDALAPTDCVFADERDYSDSLYTGTARYYGECGGTDTATIVVASRPASGEYTLIVYVRAVTERDFNVIDQILNTFQANIE